MALRIRSSKCKAEFVMKGFQRRISDGAFHLDTRSIEAYRHIPFHPILRHPHIERVIVNVALQACAPFEVLI